MADALRVSSELVLTGPITTETAHQTKLLLLRELELSTELVLHAGKVTQLDAAGAQLLYAFMTEAARRGSATRWASASIYLVEAARMLGMESCLGLSLLPAEVTSWQP